jgi:peptidase C39-like protein
MSFQLVYLSQQDPQWKNDLLGFGDPGDTIGMYGCALTSVAMLASGHGYAETPKTLNEKLKANQGFVSSGIRWDVVNKVHPQITLRENIMCESVDAPLAKINAALDAGQPVVVRVDSSPAPGLQWHYVMVYARKGNDYLMLDPYPYSPGTAKEDLLMARYSRGNPLQRSIQQVLIYQCSTSGGTISLPSTPSTTTTTPQTQPTTASSLGTGPRARVMAEVTWGLNIRSSTDTSSMANLVVNVPAGTELLLLEPNAEPKIGVNGLWVRVRTAQGQEGYAAAWYLEKVAAANPPVSTPPASSPSNEAPASSSTPAPTTDSSSTSASSTTDSSSTPTTTPTKPPDPLKVQVVVKANATNVYANAIGAQIVSVEKANARLTVIEAADSAKAKIGVKGKRINVKASNNKRGYIDGDKVKST